MNWIKLMALPEQRLPMHYDTKKSFWEIRDGKILHQERVNRVADPDSFEVLEGSDFIARDKQFVYNAWTTLQGMGRDSFKSLGDGYFSDRNRGYFDFEASMKPLKGETVDELKVLGAGYARDANHAYYCGRVIVKCTKPLTLRVIEQNAEYDIPVATDSDHCYYESAVIKGAEISTWEMVGKGFSKDAASVFFGAKKLPGAKPEEWHIIKHPYSACGDKVYCMSFALKGADIESFEVTPNGVARDRFGEFSGRNRKA